jgi:hypothetical protein
VPGFSARELGILFFPAAETLKKTPVFPGFQAREREE